jgi:CarboxypepD_reg-like domain/TonB-dependent Receptor Plug Domain
MIKLIVYFNLFLFLTPLLYAQTGGIRGKITDKATAAELVGATVALRGTDFGTAADVEGFYDLVNIPVGNYSLCVQMLGYDSLVTDITIDRKMTNLNLALSESAIKIEIEVSAEKDAQQNETQVSVISITAKDIDRMPSIGGKSDIAQYLQMTPGVTFTGDQGGQFFIRGGAPIQNKILLDGMPIYNAFHSIGFYSVFETDVVRTADIYTAGFGAKYGGRSSAVIDIKTREGNKKRLAGNITVTPFIASALIEAPIIKPKDENSPSLSFILTAKHSYLNQTSPMLYSYANEQGKLPYSFTDLFGKLSFNAGNGSRINAFGFSSNDNALFTGIADYRWRAGGGGINFRIVPGGAKLLLDGSITYSTYNSNFVEGDSSKQRSSLINSFSGNFNFIYLMANNQELDYGLEITSFYTDFNFTNNQGVPFQQAQTNSEVAAYVRYKARFGRLVIEPSLRTHYYASLGEMRVEPRVAGKFNITEYMRFKFAAGLYSQNLISSVDERDVVNLFVGFLGGPESGVYRIENGRYVKTKSRLQTATHLVAGMEFNLGKHTTLNVEPYIKYFNQIISLNRNRLTTEDPTYIAEKGSAYGVDVLGKYQKDQLYLYLGYSLGYVKRDDGVQQYSASFDRRHNLNAMVSYEFKTKRKRSEDSTIVTLQNDKKSKFPLEVSIRWNLASGFPFTSTQGFYQWQTFNQGINSNYLQSNNNPATQLGVIYEQQLNRGRLPYYHRLDISLKYTLDLSKNSKLLFTASLTNAYNRANIFYFDRVQYTRVNQLPFMPVAGITWKF